MADRRQTPRWIVTLIMLAISAEAGFVLPRSCLERAEFVRHSNSAIKETRPCCCGAAAVILKCCCDPETEVPVHPAPRSDQASIAFFWALTADVAAWAVPVSSVPHGGLSHQSLNFGATFGQPVHTRHCVWQI